MNKTRLPIVLRVAKAVIKGAVVLKEGVGEGRTYLRQDGQGRPPWSRHRGGSGGGCVMGGRSIPREGKSPGRELSGFEEVKGASVEVGSVQMVYVRSPGMAEGRGL